MSFRDIKKKKNILVNFSFCWQTVKGKHIFFFKKLYQSIIATDRICAMVM